MPSHNSRRRSKVNWLIDNQERQVTMCRKTLFLLIYAVSSILTPVTVIGYDWGVGLHYPDLRTIRQLIGPTGECNIPSGKEQEEINADWGFISQKGKDLLLKERDIVLVVIDSNGNWLYRSSGIHTLRSLYSVDEKRRKDDRMHLSDILRKPIVQNLRDFFNSLLFQQPSSWKPKIFGSILRNIDDLQKANKEWFYGIVGSEIRIMDEDIKKQFLSDSKYGPLFEQTIKIAEAEVRKQLESVWIAMQKGTDIQIDVRDIQGDAKAELTDLNAILHNYKGVTIAEWPSQAGKVFVKKKSHESDWDIKMYRSELQSIMKGEVTAWLAPPGKTEVYKVRPEMLGMIPWRGEMMQ